MAVNLAAPIAALGEWSVTVAIAGPTQATQGRWEAPLIGGRRALVWLPAEYPASGEPPAHPFPVVYLLHGHPGIYADWASGNWADVQADALMAAGRVAPAILVLPDLYGGRPAVDPGCSSAIDDYLTREVMPFVRSTYATSGRAAVGGYSTGGGCAVVYAARHPDLFGAAFSLAGFFPELPAGPVPVAFLLQVGDSDHEEVGSTRRAAAVLGVQPVLVPGVTHAFPYWKRALGLALPWALAAVGDQWPVRVTPPVAAVSLGAPAALPGELGLGRTLPPPRLVEPAARGLAPAPRRTIPAKRL
jgi:S-formylglutathione hydrolase FrmB